MGVRRCYQISSVINGASGPVWMNGAVSGHGAPQHAKSSEKTAYAENWGSVPVQDARPKPP